MQIDFPTLIANAISESVFNSLKQFWYIPLAILLIIVVQLIVAIRRKLRYIKAGMQEIDKMSGIEFEKYLKNLFSQLGYIVKHTGKQSGDYGVDLVLEKEGKKIAVQAKRSRNYIGQGAIREVFADWLDIYKSLKTDIDPYSVYYLSYPNADQIGQLEDKGIDSIADVPEDLALRAKQVAQIQTTRDNKRIIDENKIKEFIDTFEYPLYFFDYETFSSTIPAFDGCQPYKDYPFQYSLHVLEKPESELKHFEYLHTENSNPMSNLIEQLKKDIGETGTILTWNMSYEKGCNEIMAEFYPENKEFLNKVNERIEDLITPFSKMWYVDKDFFGSASLKNVLPVLAPELSYKEMDVSDGLLARRVWTETFLEGKNSSSKEKIRDDLSKYCTLDTYAMVRILEELKKAIVITEQIALPF